MSAATASSCSIGPEIDDKYGTKFAKLTPGVAEHFNLSVPVDELDLGEKGVYEFAVTLSGQTSAQPWEQVLGVQRTFLPWKPDGSGTKTKTTFLWPLISDAHMAAETGSNESQTPVFLDEDLAKEISPGGRLAQMVALGKDLDVTWVVDPDLLASVDAMSHSYEVRGADGRTTAGKHQAVAKQWLADLQDAVEDKEVVALPFADPDLASLAHNGTDITGSLSQLKDATDVVANTVEPILHVKPSTDFAWPAEGAVDPSIVKVATSAGADKVIARSDSLQETGGLTYTPSAARPIGGGTTAVVADARLSTAFEGDLTKASASTAAVQRFLAQSLQLGLQTGKQRSVVVAPQRMPTGSQARAMAEALTALADGTWSQAQDLTDAAAAKPDPGATTKVPTRSSYPAKLRKQELPHAAFEQIARTQDKLGHFKVVLSDESRVVTPFGRALNRGMSTAWRGRAAEAQAFRDGVETYLDGLTGQVRLIDKSETKLSGRSATIPVTVQNNLVQGVDHLVLRLTSTNPTRLKIGGDAYQERPVTVSGGHSQSVKFTTSANANGQATVVAQLFTADGQPYGQAVTFDVKVTEITATVMLVIGGGVLLLVLAGYRMYQQRKRAAARTGDEDGPGEDGDGTAGGPENPAGPEERLREESGAHGRAGDPVQPSDPTPDTAAESADPSGTGERVDR
ncbi:Secreted protein OS=Streptomyces fumanus OX=67302 GN=GCM10018772_12690 PE=4 SV=1 [Streptomyces fumanus]